MIAFGLPDGVLGVAWPSMSKTFGVSLASLGFMTITFTATYTVAGFVSGLFLSRITLGLWLGISGLVVGSGFLGYALAPSWWALLLMTGIAGIGGGFLDTGVNLFAAKRLTPRLTNWIHSAFSLGGFAGAPLMTGLIVAGLAWDWGFVLIAGLFGLFVIIVLVTVKRWQAFPDETPASAEQRGSLWSTLRLPAAQLSMVSFFLYTGVEVVAAVWSFTLLTEDRGLTEGYAGVWVTAYFGGLVIGRAGLGTFANRITSDKLLWISAAIAATGATVFWLVTPGITGLFALAILGFGLGPIFPTLISATGSKVGQHHVQNAVGFQIAAAALGGGLVPAGVGLLASATSLEAVAVVLAAGSLLLLVSLRVLAKREILTA